MLYLFCSAAAPLYKRDALASMSYPIGHTYRFRYEHGYVQKGVLDRVGRFSGTDGVLVFADTVGERGAMDFDFVPVRRIKAIRLSSVAGALYVDFELGEFFHYGPESSTQTVWSEFFKGMSERPWPPPNKSGRRPDEQGCFVLLSKAEVPHVEPATQNGYEKWQSVVKRLDATKDLRGATFYLVLGFYSFARRFGIGRLKERGLPVQRHGLDSTYSVPMGRSIVLKILLSRPSFDYEDPQSGRTLKITAGSDAFSGLSKDKVYSESRYNEDRTIFVCRRVFDSALATVSIEEENVREVRSAQVTLLTRVKVPRWVVVAVVGGVALTTFLIGLTAESVQLMGNVLPNPFGEMVRERARGLATLGGALSPLPVSWATYLAFRRLPIK